MRVRGRDPKHTLKKFKNSYIQIFEYVSAQTHIETFRCLNISGIIYDIVIFEYLNISHSQLVRHSLASLARAQGFRCWDISPGVPAPGEYLVRLVPVHRVVRTSAGNHRQAHQKRLKQAQAVSGAKCKGCCGVLVPTEAHWRDFAPLWRMDTRLIWNRVWCRSKRPVGIKKSRCDAHRDIDQAIAPDQAAILVFRVFASVASPSVTMSSKDRQLAET